MASARSFCPVLDPIALGLPECPNSIWSGRYVLSEPKSTLLGRISVYDGGDPFGCTQIGQLVCKRARRITAAEASLFGLNTTSTRQARSSFSDMRRTIEAGERR